MKKLLLLPLMFLLSLNLHASMKGWETDYDTAFKKAAESDKQVLALFTGSDWCPPCMMMEKKVFSKSAFVKEASEHYVLLMLDFPKGDPALKAKNTPFAKTHKVQGFPSVLLLDAEKKEFNRVIASTHPSIDEFVKYLSTSLEKKGME